MKRLPAAFAFVVLALLALLTGCASVPPTEVSAEGSRVMRERPERLIVVAVANPTSGTGVAAASTSAGYTSLQPYLAGAHARRVIDSLKQQHRLSEVAAWPIRVLRLHCVVLELPEGAARAELLAALARDPRVEIAQPLNGFEVLAGAAPMPYNDPYAPLQQGFALVQAALAHAGTRGQGVSVALIDTGVDTTHPDLRGRFASAHNLVDRDEVQFARDRHGTEVAGVIAAVANNRLGIVGVAPEAKLRAYKACWQRDEGKSRDSPHDKGGARCNSFTLALALAASLREGARVINLSLAGPPDELLARLLRRLIESGRIVVGAVPPDGSLDGFPLGVAGVIAVDSSGRPERRGVLKAPGRDVLTLAPGGHYDFASGSSLAAAHVSGVIALLLALPQPPGPEAVPGLLALSRLRNDGADSISACQALAALGQPVDCASAGAGR